MAPKMARAVDRLVSLAHAPQAPWILLTVVAAAQAAVFVPLVAFRSVDGDEGTYLTAATLAVDDGKLPYADFLYTQTPLLPYVYGTWTAVLGESWYVARPLSVICAIAVGVLLYRYLAGRFGPGLGFVGVGLYASSALVFAWFVTVKTYALSTLFLFSAFVLVDRAAPRWMHFAGAGVLLGLAIDTRLLFAGAVPAFAWAVLRCGRATRLPALAGLTSGLALGIAPSLGFLARDPDRFLFDNLWYHGSRSSDGLVGDLDQKLAIAASLLGAETRGRPYPQFLLLVVGAVAAALAARALGRRMPLALLIAAFLAVVSLLPTPTYGQYFSVAVPFLVVGVLELVDAVRTRPALADRQLALALRWLLMAALGAYVLLAVPEFSHIVRTSAIDRPAPVADVAAFVDMHTRPGEEVLSGWPGYLFGSHAVPVPGLENDFAPHEAAALSLADARRYRLATVADVERMIRERRTRLVVAKSWENILPPVPDYAGVAEAAGYRVVAEINQVRIYGLDVPPVDG